MSIGYEHAVIGFYTAFVEAKHSDGGRSLGALLRELRGEARLSQAELAKRAGISAEPIKSAETEGHIPKPATLEQIATGLATYAPGRTDRELARDYYIRLMVAAGFLPAGSPAPPAELRATSVAPSEMDEISALLSQIPDASMALSSLGRGSDDWDDEDREYLRIQLLRLARRFGRTQAAS